MTVVSPLGDVCGNRLVRHDKRAACLRHLTHLAVEVFDGTCSVLTHHQSADAVVGSVASAIVILHVVFRMVGIVDTCQTVVVVGIGYHLAFLRHVSRLLGEHIAEWVVCECGCSACRVVDLRTAVTHVVNGCRHIALSISDSYKSLYAVILKCGGNLTVRTAVLDGLDCLPAAVGDSGLAVSECVRHLCHECVGTAVKGIFRCCL